MDCILVHTIPLLCFNYFVWISPESVSLDHLNVLGLLVHDSLNCQNNVMEMLGLDIFVNCQCIWTVIKIVSTDWNVGMYISLLWNRYNMVFQH